MKIEYMPGTIAKGESQNTVKEKKQLEESCKSFESYFVAQVLTRMRDTVSSNSSQENEIFQGWLDMKLADEIAASGQLGLAKILYEQITNEQNSLGKKEEGKGE